MTADAMTPSELDALLRRARALADQHCFIEAKKVLADAYTQNGWRPSLLQEIASIENKQGDRMAAFTHLAEAHSQDRADIGIARDYIRTLYVCNLYSAVMSAIQELSPRQRSDQEIRTVLGNVYRDIGWHAHAVREYGSLRNLSGRTQYSSWVRSGGPFRVRRSRRWDLECGMIGHWRNSSAAWQGVLEELELPQRANPASFRIKLGSLHLRMLAAQDLQEILEKKRNSTGWQVVNFATALLLSFVLTYLGWGSIDIAQALLAGEFAWIISFTVHVIIYRPNRANGFPARQITACWETVVVAGFFLAVAGKSASSWQATVGLVASVAGMAHFLLYKRLYGYAELIGNLRRQYPSEVIVGYLLDILSQLGDLDKRVDSKARRLWITKLGDAAWIMEHLIPKQFEQHDPAVRKWITNHSSDAASAFRGIACAIALPQERPWNKIAANLRRTTIVTAAGEFSALRAGSLEFPEQVPSWREHAIKYTPYAGPVVALVLLTVALMVFKDRNMISMAEQALYEGLVSVVITIYTTFVLQRRVGDSRMPMFKN